MHVEAHHSMDELAAWTRRETDARVVRRIFALMHAKRGADAEAVARDCGAKRRTVQEWVERYNGSGLDGLRDKPGRGRRPKLPGEQLEAFKARIAAGPTQADGGVCVLRGKDARRILREQFGVVQSLSAVYATLRRAGLAALRPRPRNPKSDPAAMEAWTERAPPLSTPPGSRIRGVRSRSGLRTRHASASRAR
jgi:transposase